MKGYEHKGKRNIFFLVKEITLISFRMYNYIIRNKICLNTTKIET